MAVGIHNAATAVATLASGTPVNLAMGIRSAPDRYLVFSIAMRSNTSSVSAGTVFWQPAGTTTGQQELTFLGARNHATDVLRVEQWGLLAPTVSTASSSRLTFTTNSGVKAAYTAQCFERVNQTTPYDGYPSVPTNFGSDSGATLASPVGETTGFTVTTVTGEYVVDVFGSDLAATTNNYNTLNDVYLTGRVTVGGGITSNVRMGTSWEVATGASTTMKWKSFVGSTTSFNSGQSGRTYVHCGFPLKPSTSVAPQWVMPPNEVVAVGGTTSSAIRFNSISDWPTAGSFAQHGVLGPTEMATAINVLPKQFTSHTATVLTGAATYAGSVAMGDNAIYKMIDGDGQSILGSGSVVLYVPSNALENDVMIITVYSQIATTTVTAATFNTAGAPTATQIAAQATSNMLQTILYKRLSAADIGTANLSCTITFSATPTWRSATAQLYRGCVTTGAPYVTAGDGAPTVNTGSVSNPVITGVTTPAADHTVIMSAMKWEGGTTWTSPFTSSAVGERLEWFNQWWGEMVMPTAGATGNQTITVSNINDTWSTMAITLIPSNVGFAHSATLLQTGRAYSDDTVSRLAVMARAPAQSGRVYSNDTVSKLIAFIRTTAQSGRVYSNDAVTRSRGTVRTITETAFGAAADNTVTRRVGFVRNRTQSRAFISALVASTLGGITAFVRTLAQSGRVYSNDTVTKLQVLRRTLTQSGRAYSNDTLGRLVRYIRNRTQSGRVYSNDTVTRLAANKRTLTHTRPTGFVITVVVNTTGGAISFYDYGSPNQPVYQKIDDVAATFPGVSFYFEAQLKSNVNSVSYAELYDVTASAVVGGSQVSTSAPHTTSQIVRSGAINLVSGHVYKARIGHATTVLTEPSTCRIIARDVS